MRYWSEELKKRTDGRLAFGSDIFWQIAYWAYEAGAEAEDGFGSMHNCY
jgi:hypothetical protein